MKRDVSGTAISPTVGTFILVAIVVITATVLAVSFFGFGYVDEAVHAGVLTEYDPTANQFEITYVSAGNSEDVTAVFRDLTVVNATLQNVGDRIVIDFDGSGEAGGPVIRFSGDATGTITVQGNVNVNESLSDPSPPCGDVDENVQESENVQENQNDGVYEYVYSYEYTYQHGDYEYTYDLTYEWTGQQNPDPEFVPDPSISGDYCVDMSSLNPSPEPDPQPDPGPNATYAGSSSSTSQVSHPVGFDGDVSSFDVVFVARSGHARTVLYTEKFQR